MAQKPMSEERLAELERVIARWVPERPHILLKVREVRELVAEVRRRGELLDQQGDLPGDLAVARGEIERLKGEHRRAAEYLGVQTASIDDLIDRAVRADRRVAELEAIVQTHQTTSDYEVGYIHGEAVAAKRVGELEADRDRLDDECLRLTEARGNDAEQYERMEAELVGVRSTLDRVQRLCEAQGADSYVMVYALRRALGGGA